ncbi:unnamed protein product, partial [Rotaria sordida]
MSAVYPNPTQAPPVFTQAPPGFTQAPPGYTQAPPVFIQPYPMNNQPNVVIVQHQNKDVQHGCHLLLWCFTAGLWTPCWIAACCGCCKMEETFLNNQINVIPQPLTIQELPGIFILSNDTIIVATASCENELTLFKNSLKEDFDFEFPDKTDSTSVIKLILNDNRVKDESYHLHVDVNKIEIIGWSTTGIFYGLQTLKQLINNKEKLTIPCVHIEDQPRFQWRSFMLDVARHFKNTSTIKQLLNEMSQLKMNRFHWHLTDDQGWRIEIKKYPKLTEIGSIRSCTQSGWKSMKYDYTIHEGYYTQEEIKDIIQYANERHIQIVPEIEMPGHASAAIASYSSLGCNPQQQINVP